jgi:hypothetical protein
MDPETVQIDFEWARNLEHPHGGFNFCESYLILAKPGWRANILLSIAAS